MTKNYDNLNRLTSITSTPLGSSAFSYSYSYNSANQRTQTVLADGSYWTYSYDSLGQVIAGQKYWSDNTPVAGEQFGYAFDTIGNRQSITANGNLGTYTANSLNQYTQRSVPGYVWELGDAASNATVTVNLQPTVRKGQFFSKELSVANSSSAVYTQLTTVAVLKNAGVSQYDIVTTATGHEFVAKSPELYSYDADGNLTNDGRFAYQWDGENRLISMVAQASLPAGVPQEKILFGYDYMGRRVSKVVSNFNGSAWSLGTGLKFVYDGWNLLAEIDTNNAIVRSYTWGLDLSGSPQGAGGIGGLLMISTASSGTHLPAYDGNGNVMALVDGSSGSVSAQYEYGPFGETLRATGTAASLNPFRFSTKCADAETELLYYGYRYYTPNAGRWLNRDPITESGSHLSKFPTREYQPYLFNVDDGVNKYDFIGMMPLSAVESIYQARKNATAAANIMCCNCCHVTHQYSIYGGALGGSIVFAGTSWKNCTDGACNGPYNSTYFWWDCYSSGAEAGLLHFPPSGDLRYGWSQGDRAYFKVATPSSLSFLGQFFGFDPYHLAVASIVMYEQCVNGQAQTLETFSNTLEFTWSISSQHWTGPTGNP